MLSFIEKCVNLRKHGSNTVDLICIFRSFLDILKTLDVGIFIPFKHIFRDGKMHEKKVKEA